MLFSVVVCCLVDAVAELCVGLFAVWLCCLVVLFAVSLCLVCYLALLFVFVWFRCCGLFGFLFVVICCFCAYCLGVYFWLI